MPREAWVEIRDEAGELLKSIPARIDGGAVSAELPAFAPGTRGTIQLCTDENGSVFCEDEEVEELPTDPLLFVVQMG